MHSDAQRNQHKVKTDQSKATQSKTERGKHQNRTGENAPKPAMTPFWRFQILTTIRLTLARSGLCLDRGRDRICGYERVHDRGRRHVHVRDLGCRLAIWISNRKWATALSRRTLSLRSNHRVSDASAASLRAEAKLIEAKLVEWMARSANGNFGITSHKYCR